MLPNPQTLAHNVVTTIFPDRRNSAMIKQLSKLTAPFTPQEWLAASHVVDDLVDQADDDGMECLRGQFSGYLLRAMAELYRFYVNPPQQIPHNLAPFLYRNLEARVLQIHGVARVPELVKTLSKENYSSLQQFATQIEKYMAQSE